MHLKRITELEIEINNTLASGTLSPHDTHLAMNAITVLTKAKHSINCYRGMEGLYYIKKAEETWNSREK